MTRSPKASLCGLLFLAAIAPGVAADAPRVVRAEPDNGDTAVDPATRQIRIVFDRDMGDASHSVVGGGPAFPKLLGRPRWADKRTFVMRVRLEPSHQYRLSINNAQFNGFRDEDGQPATPYPVTFETGAAKPRAGGAAEALAEMNGVAIDVLREAVDKDYSYRDLREADWETLFRDARPKLEKAATPKEFAAEAAKLLAHAQDLHVWLKVGEEIVGTHQRRVTPNVNGAVLAKVVPDLRRHGRAVLTGKFDDGVRYVMITAWSSDAASLEPAFAALREAADEKAPGLILDVRPNAGGDELTARQVAGCFLVEPKVYSTNFNVAGGKSYGPFDRAVEPTPNRPHYGGKVAVLMGPANMSSCESFLLMMKQVPGCKLVGMRSYGSSGNPRPQDLGNGVTVFLSSWKDMLPDGSIIEGVGVPPDVEVKTEPKDFKEGDPVLEAALKLVR